jgi:tetratricopeptide (TPR) repeat protein
VDGAELWAALAANNDRTDPTARAARAEYLVEAAEAVGDTLLLVTALQQLISAFEFNGESDKMLTPFARVLRFWDTESGSFDSPRRHTMFWQFKWTTSQLLTLPQVPLGTIRQWLGEMESRYRQAGYSARPVHQSRLYLASHLGETETARTSFDAWLTEPRDAMADCEACERNAQGDWNEEQGDDERALSLWQPVLDGQLTCAEEPHRLLGSSLLPLLRLGRADQARSNHLRGYRMARGRPNLRATVGDHLVFCALSGNTARGLEILAEHKAWLDDQGENISKRRAFLEGVSVLLRRLDEQGRADLPIGSTDVRTLRAKVDAEIDTTCARYDIRNGNTRISERSAQRRAQQPLLDYLPLGSAGQPVRRSRGLSSSAGLVQGSALDPTTDPTTDPAAALVSATTPEPASEPTQAQTKGLAQGPATELSLDDQVAEARRLTTLGHPRALAAWERIARHEPLPPLVQAQIDRARVRERMAEDPAGVLPSLHELADRLATLEAPVDLLLKSRSDVVTALFLADDREQAEQLGGQLDEAVEAAYAEGVLTDRQYLGLRSRRLQLAYHAYETMAAATAQSPAPNPDSHSEPIKALLRDEAELADRLGGPGQAGLYRRMLAQLAFAAEQFDEAEVLLTEAVEQYLAGERPWAAAEALALLGQLALRGGRVAEAEEHARAAQRHAAGLLPPPLTAQVASILVESLIRQAGRDGDLVDAALRAAGAWESISEPDTLHNRFTAARAYLALKQYGEAAALFEEFLPRVGAAYDAIGTAQTREQFATCLTELGEHRQAAEQLLTAARLVQGDPANQRAHARLAWLGAQALERADQPAAALPAFRRAAELWGALGALVPRVRCLRSVAWLLAWSDPAEESDGMTTQSSAGPDWPAAIGAMRAVLAELETVPAERRDESFSAELANTEQQLGQMIDYQERAKDGAGPG